MPKINDIPQNKGKVVEFEDGTKAAILNEGGVLKAFSVVCPHLGCDVEWNDAGNTWDCPCHGSRFRKDGSLIQGPAQRGLDTMEIKMEGDEIKLQR